MIYSLQTPGNKGCQKKDDSETELTQEEAMDYLDAMEYLDEEVC